MSGNLCRAIVDWDGDYGECCRPAKARVWYSPTLYSSPISMCGWCIGALKRRRSPPVVILSEIPFTEAEEGRDG